MCCAMRDTKALNAVVIRRTADFAPYGLTMCLYCHVQCLLQDAITAVVDIIGRFLVEEGGEQCGFCSPGLIMNVIAMKKEFRANGNLHPTDDEIKHFLAGNLCRCTGYMSQMRAIRKYVETEVN